MVEVTLVPLEAGLSGAGQRKTVPGMLVEICRGAATYLEWGGGGCRNKQLKLRPSARLLSDEDQVRNVHDGAQTNEPARAAEEGSTPGVSWKFVAGLSGHGPKRQQLGETRRVPPESDESHICGIHRE